MAPELLRGESHNSTASDVYSFGIILYEVYSRKDPYAGEDMEEVLRLVADAKVNKRPEIPQEMPPMIQALMTDCLVADPQQRPTFAELDQRLLRVDETRLETNHIARSGKRRNISLFDIFPPDVAKSLAEGRKVEPLHRDMVTIFFSDIVGKGFIMAEKTMSYCLGHHNTFNFSQVSRTFPALCIRRKLQTC